jgi:hypothetical protein
VGEEGVVGEGVGDHSCGGIWLLADCGCDGITGNNKTSSLRGEKSERVYYGEKEDEEKRFGVDSKGSANRRNAGQEIGVGRR